MRLLWRRSRSWRGGSLKAGLQLLLIAGLAHAGDVPATLRLPEGQFMTGRLEPSPSGNVFRWQSPAFLAPFEFEIDDVTSIQFPLPDKLPVARGDYRLELTGGDLLFGNLVSISEDDVELETAPFGRLRIRRNQVVRIHRAHDGVDLIYNGPDGLAGWQVMSVAGPNVWQEDAGRLGTSQQGAVLYRDFKLPSKVVIELTLSWTKRPDFVIGLGVADATAQALRNAYTLEIWDNHLVLQRETAKEADFESLQKVDTAGGSASLVLYLDQSQGRCQVFSSRGKRLADVQTSPPNPEPLSGIVFKNQKGDLQIDRLRIGRWNAPLPADPEGQDAFVQRTDGTLVPGVMQEFDAQAGEFVIRTPTGSSRLKMAEVAIVSLAAPGEEPPRPLCASFLDGTRLSGALVQVEADSVRLNCPSVRDALRIPIADLRSLIVLDPARNPIAHSAPRLEMQGVRLRGQLEDNPQESTSNGLLWKPYNSRTSSGLQPGVPGRIVFREREREAPSAVGREDNDAVVRKKNQALPAPFVAGRGGPNQPARRSSERKSLHLRTGDTISCDVNRIDEAGVHFVTANSDATFVPHAQVKGVDLVPYPELRSTKVGGPLRDPIRQQLLTLPRLQKANPPTQIIESTRGDFLRGRLLSLDEQSLKLEVRLEKKDIPRDRVARIIWLHADELEPPTDVKVADPEEGAAEPPDRRVQSLRKDGVRLTFRPLRVLTGTLLGKSELLGDCWVEIDEIDELLIARGIEQSASQLALHQFKLHHALEPKAAPEGEEGGGPTSGRESSLVGKPAPLFELNLLKGERIRLEELKGKVVVLDFFATWCGPCVQSMPQVEAVAREFPQDVRLVAVNLEETPERVTSLLERHKLDVTVALDVDGAVAARYEASAIPQTVIIDREGKIRRVFVGAGPKFGDQLREALRAVLQGEQPAAPATP